MSINCMQSTDQQVVVQVRCALLCRAARSLLFSLFPSACNRIQVDPTVQDDSSGGC